MKLRSYAHGVRVNVTRPRVEHAMNDPVPVVAFDVDRYFGDVYTGVAVRLTVAQAVTLAERLCDAADAADDLRGSTP